jgi:mannose/fructose/N-acetylgalactosamine-specific phosphotransferase system component IIC
MSDETQNQQADSELSHPPSAPEPEPVSQVQHVRPHVKRTNAVAAGIGIAGWLLPGLGHALQKMWGRALACFLAVGILVLIGSGMRGNLFQSGDTDAFGRLGYIADVGTGSFYWLAKWLEVKGPDVSRADGDYGTRFLAAAGVLNLLAALHAYEAARGRKA